jgi:hypothetical protein
MAAKAYATFVIVKITEGDSGQTSERTRIEEGQTTAKRRGRKLTSSVIT